MIYYAHTGGYTELGGLKYFLKKINNLDYKLLFPAREKRPKKSKDKTKDGVAEIQANDVGVTGKKLLQKVKEKVSYHSDIKVIIIFDDGDCRIKNSILNESIERLKKELKGIDLIFLFAEPEIEKWFCLDKSCVKNRSCGDKGKGEKSKKDLHGRLNELLDNFNYEFDKEKNSCKEKFSEKFRAVLNQCGVSYNKRYDGSEYLKLISPEKIAKRDEIARKGIELIKKIKS